ncbi:MAG: sigma-54 dependent transcriptional regulator [Gemmatimonadota bacterium]|nr:sigma-54 dependent transcriptional regulator [Gemmatimonadota bacterium]
MSRILIVEDVAPLREQYAYDLRRLGGHEALEADSVERALELIATEAVDCVILDLELPGADGFGFLEARRARGLDVPVIVYTGTGNFDRCVRAVELGAYGFIDKAEPMERVLREVDHALERVRLAEEVTALRARAGLPGTMVGESPAMRALRAEIVRLARVPSAVLVLGESGVGKELVARDLHGLSPHADGPFVAVNCAALPDALVESELFGHERGAFTGADRVRRGAFERASGGTLLLDEIGELPLSVQAKLLRVLEDGRVTRVGGSREVESDARIVAATNRDPEKEVEAGRFREDLLYRINVHSVTVPPLRERPGDVARLADHFLRETASRFGRRVPEIAPGAVALLEAEEWRRNNVRELRNVVERLVIAADGGRVEAAHVEEAMGARPGVASAKLAGGTLRDQRDAAERAIVQAALTRHDGNLTHAAAELGLADHASLSKILTRLGIHREA